MIIQTRFQPWLMPSVGNGDLVVRGCKAICPYSPFITSDVVSNSMSSVFNVPNSLSGAILFFHFDLSYGPTIAIVVVRLDDLAHLHTDPSEARLCGRLRLVVYAYYVSQPGHSPSTRISVFDKREGLGSHTSKERYTPRCFPSVTLSWDYYLDHLENEKYKYDMDVPRDEWRLSIIGIADIRVSVERMYFDDDDNDDDGSDDDGPNSDKMHRFADVLDIAVTRNTNKDSSDEENGDRQDIEEVSTDEEAAGDGDTGDESVDNSGTREGVISNGGKNDQNQLAAKRKRNKRKRSDTVKLRRSKRIWSKKPGTTNGR
ncbi:hypothetical protein GGR51DRAFT_536945 [Nemania sp. FL0031]|nr:hypothetical protein GGR51DRAFT_536945 [Nemania sp. FL0031]